MVAGTDRERRQRVARYPALRSATAVKKSHGQRRSGSRCSARFATGTRSVPRSCTVDAGTADGPASRRPGDDGQAPHPAGPDPDITARAARSAGGFLQPLQQCRGGQVRPDPPALDVQPPFRAKLSGGADRAGHGRSESAPGCGPAAAPLGLAGCNRRANLQEARATSCGRTDNSAVRVLINRDRPSVTMHLHRQATPVISVRHEEERAWSGTSRTGRL